MYHNNVNVMLRHPKPEASGGHCGAMCNAYLYVMYNVHMHTYVLYVMYCTYRIDLECLNVEW